MNRYLFYQSVVTGTVTLLLAVFTASCGEFSLAAINVGITGINAGLATIAHQMMRI